jgi:hypothetical protein
MKVSELSGKALDWAVIKAIYPGADDSAFWLNFTQANSHTTDWALAGPIIECEKITLGIFKDIWIAYSQALFDAGTCGPTAIIAAMRCFVASKLGDEVDIPKELL